MRAEVKALFIRSKRGNWSSLHSIFQYQILALQTKLLQGLLIHTSLALLPVILQMLCGYIQSRALTTNGKQ